MSEVQARKTEANTPDPDDPRKPDSPTDLTKPSFFYVVRKVVREFSRDQCTDLAAALTYYAVLSLFPALLALVSLLGIFGQGEKTVDSVLQMVDDLGPSSAVDTLRGPVEQLVDAPSAGLTLIIGLVGAIWSASGYVGAFGRAMNRMYEVDEGRPIWKLRPVVLLVTVIALVMAAAVALMLAISGPVARSIGDVIGLGDTALLVWNIARWPIVLIFVVLTVAILYYATPNVQQPKFRWISVGAAVAIVTWIVASVLFALYVSNFSSYNKTYGALAGVIVFLLWLWITNLALLFGAEVDAELERGRQLQAGIPAEKSLQLPPRDTKVSDKNAEKDADFVERGRQLRRTHGDDDNALDDNGSLSSTAGPVPETSNANDSAPTPPETSSVTPPQRYESTATGDHAAADDLTVVQLVDRLQAQLRTLVRTEITNALAEVKSKGSRLGLGLGISAAGLGVLVFCGGALVAFGVLALATVVEAWLAALIIGVALLAVGGVVAYLGARRAAAAVPPLPERTAQSVQRDVAAIRTT
ncbi:YhjD/YihY/BrkB family envelope integrity protein [Williamsia sp. 1135]|uniref:YhjD/YihY/BrkB family envelope integrity protein n=1 Tax=Williamsia sp. 1135 TaxID=1889262 RepID=UPI000A10045A|nr:YhjD/YihY/BrkB family envelope integrity protein [Williamsia sp. 1135]ORM30642.1 transposase [Williamsia sp. 1135]